MMIIFLTMRTNTVKYQVVKVLGLRIYNVKKRELLCHSDGLNHAQNRVPFSGDLRQVNSSVQSCSTFGSKNGLLAVYAPPSTLGGCALALHYANVIIVIEKLLSYPRNGNCRVLIFSNEYILDVEILNMNHTVLRICSYKFSRNFCCKKATQC